MTAGAKVENQQEFADPPSLGDLRRFLGVICEELREYNIWPVSQGTFTMLSPLTRRIKENCWLFCSLLQQYLAGTCRETSTRGQIIARDLAPRLRRRVNTFVHDWDPMPLASRVSASQMKLWVYSNLIYLLSRSTKFSLR